MSSDPLLKAAITHWGPRFVANGVVLTDFEEVTGSISSYDDWCSAWSARAAHHEQLGRQALAKEHFLTAGECLQRAGVYYHFASFLFVHDQAQMKAAHKKQIECRQASLPHLRPPGERVEIPYEGSTLAGILRKPAGVERPPVVVMAVGLDSTKEEGDAYEAPFLARGIATLIFEGPGQGEAEYDFPIRYDYENVVAPVIDWVKANVKDVDSERIGIWGISLGGYYAPRTVAFEKRIRAAVANCGPYNWGALWDKLPELTRAAYVARSHSKSDAEAKKKAFTLALEGVASKIECPLLVIAAGLDRLCPPEDAQRLARESKGQTELLLVALAPRAGRHFLRSRERRQEERSQDGDDRNDDEQFDECEGAAETGPLDGMGLHGKFRNGAVLRT